MPCEMEAGREVAYALADALLALTTAAYRDHLRYARNARYDTTHRRLITAL